MKNNIITLLIIMVTMVGTALVSFNIYKENFKTPNSCQLNEETCINFLQSGTQMALNSVAAYERQKMDYTLENYIKTIVAAKG